MKPESKIDNVRQALLKGRSVNSSDIIHKYGLQDVYGTIKKLRAQGMAIITTMKTNKKGGRYAAYSI